MAADGSPSTAEAGDARPKARFTGEFAPDSEAAVQAARLVLKAIAAVEVRQRARRTTTKKYFETAVIAVLCEATVDLLERGSQGFRCSRSMSVLERKDRYRSKALNPQLPQALDRLAELGFIRQDKGFLDPVSGKRWQTAVWPGPALESLCEDRNLSRDDFRSDRPGDEIVLRSERADGFKSLEAYPDTPATRMMRREMEEINTTLRSAEIETVGLDVPPLTDPTKRKLRRMFKLRPDQSTVDAFEEGGRLAGGFWLDHGLGGEARLNGILIEGKPLAEIDFGQSGLRILYGMTGAGGQLPQHDGADLYAGISEMSGEHARDAVKSFIGALMNIPKGDWGMLSKLKGFAETIVGRTFDDESDALKGALGAVHRRHPAVADHLPSEIGRKVQKIEADILVRSLLWLGHRRIVGLPVHDAILVRNDRAEEAAAIMRQVFLEVSGAPSEVSIRRSAAALMAMRTDGQPKPRRGEP